MTPRGSVLLLILLLISGCSGSARVSAGTHQDPKAQVQGGRMGAGSIRLKPEVCQGISMRPEYDHIDEQDLMGFLRAQSLEVGMTRARSDLVYLDVREPGGKSLRLRVAILDSAPEAGYELHEGILQHGRGSWGVHRSNIAVLCPIASNKEIMRFASRSKLACWGVLTMAGRDDTFVVPGGYLEP